MKTLHKCIIGAAVAALGTAMLSALSIQEPAKRLDASASIIQTDENRMPETNHIVKAPRKVSGTGGDLYWQHSVSIYNDKGSVQPANGMVRQFGTRVKIEGTKAEIYGMIDFWSMEVDQEYPVTGIYDPEKRTITIEGTGYDEDRPLADFIHVADLYNPYNHTNYVLCLFAGDNTDEGILITDQLVLQLSEDMTVVTPDVDYGAYAFLEDGTPAGFYDYYGSSEWTRVEDGVHLCADVEQVDFKNQFVAPLMPGTAKVSLFNKGTEGCSYSVTSSSPGLEVTPAEGVIDYCGTQTLTVTLNPESAGRFKGTITVSSEHQILEIPVCVEVQERPDYTNIVREGSAEMGFTMSEKYPFAIGTYDGQVAAVSTNNDTGDYSESWFGCVLDIPSDKVGVFTWKASMHNLNPNGLFIYLDDEYLMFKNNCPNTQAYDMSGSVVLDGGKHEVVFQESILIDWILRGYDINSYAYVWDLDFQLLDKQPDNAMLKSDAVNFGVTYYDNMPVGMHSEVTLLNLGTNPLKVTGVSANGNFSGSVPSVTAPICGEITVPLTWQCSGIGEENDIVTIHTTSGDFEVSCCGTALQLPYDFQSLVTEGQFSFNTGIEWPFLIDENGGYAYNSTAKADIDGITWSWIEAQFEVPEGKVGRLSWEAVNDSEEMFVFQGIPSMVNGTQITLDGENKVEVVDLNTPCSSQDVYSRDMLNFRAGIHNVRFAYRKSFNEDEREFGDDCLKLYGIGLKLVNEDEMQGSLSIQSADFEQEVFVGTAGHMAAAIVNYSALTPELLGSKCDGPFNVKSMGVEDSNLNIMIEFAPEHEGAYADVLTIMTNLGTFSLPCSGNAQKSDLGRALYYDSFEYDTIDGWHMVDMLDQGQVWRPMTEWGTSFKTWGGIPYDGNEALMIAGYEPGGDNWTGGPEDSYAMTPEIAIPSDGCTTLRFMCKSFGFEEMALGVSAGEGDDPMQFTALGEVIAPEATSVAEAKRPWTAYTFDLTGLAGKTIRVAFHIDERLEYFFAIDDVLVASTGESRVDCTDGRATEDVEYYSPDGLRIETPAKGINICLKHHADGTVKSYKIVVK